MKDELIKLLKINEEAQKLLGQMLDELPRREPHRFMMGYMSYPDTCLICGLGVLEGNHLRHDEPLPRMKCDWCGGTGHALLNDPDPRRTNILVVHCIICGGTGMTE